MGHQPPQAPVALGLSSDMILIWASPERSEGYFLWKKMSQRKTVNSCVQLGVHQGPQVLFFQAAFKVGSHQPALVPGALSPQKQACFPSPSWSLWMAVSPSGVSAATSVFVSFAVLERIPFAPSSALLMEMLNRITPHVNPWGRLLMSVLASV